MKDYEEKLKLAGFHPCDVCETQISSQRVDYRSGTKEIVPNIAQTRRRRRAAAQLPASVP